MGITSLLSPLSGQRPRSRAMPRWTRSCIRRRACFSCAP